MARAKREPSIGPTHPHPMGRLYVCSVCGGRDAFPNTGADGKYKCRLHHAEDYAAQMKKLKLGPTQYRTPIYNPGTIPTDPKPAAPAPEKKPRNKLRPRTPEPIRARRKKVS